MIQNKKQKDDNRKLKPIVFFPAFLLLIFTIVLNFVNYDAFISITTKAKDFMVIDMGWMYNLIGIMCLVMIILAYLSPLGNVKLGGPSAKPMLKKSSWFAITICTTIAAGILFWGTSEPIWHLAYPPESLGIEPMSNQAAKFAMETMYLHWTFIPYAIYAVPTIVFAFAYYNMKRSFSVGSQISPLVSENKQKKLSVIIDAVVLFTVAAGISSSLGTAILNMGGGLNAVFGVENGKTLWIFLTIIATLVFMISSGTGLMRGIKYLSDANMYIYYLILSILLFIGPTAYYAGLGTEAFGGFLDGIFSKAMFTGTSSGDTWASSWTMFYWSNWLAWAPVSAVFLARISYGYKIKDVIVINFIAPSIFSVLWMTIISGTALNFQLTGRVDVLGKMNELGSEAAVYAVLGELPFSGMLSILFLVAIFISFITATDSTTNAMASICTTGIKGGEEEAPLFIKIIWGSTVGLVALVFISTLGIDGIRMMSYLGGFPALFLGIFTILSLFVIIQNPCKFDKYAKVDIDKEKYNE
ncbi:BCCT family transporter [Alkalibacter saccharofermentans]|uniref:Choline-glycine betaine transporter n=1 Tax=Alkalibacter saccharofermentans DSM 14828 TaxID=1120975 RepID=A0A1M4UWE3_9FIRM|nr:BCCT family transporter [Alkalibacter saccharofermentans]SHE61024.1 Choline-glycine betaine transporter [Alkalibacter saccharofermentans DSM 14828]